MNKIASAVLLALILGCTAEEPVEIPEHLQDLENLTAYSPDTGPENTLTLEREVSYGDTDDVFLGRILRNPAVDKNGRVYIADFEAGTVHVYKADGTYLENVGREGQGPGEFQQITELRVSDHQLHVLDYNQKISVFDLESFQHETDLDVSIGQNAFTPSWLDWTRDEALFYRVNDFYVRTDGSYLLLFSDSGVGMADNIDGRTVEAVAFNPADGSFEELDLSFRWSGQVLVHEEDGQTMIMFRVPYKRSSQYDFNNGILIHGWTDEMTFRIHDEEGAYQRSFYYPYNRARLRIEDATAVYEENERSVRAILSDSHPETWPAFNSIKIDDKSRLWISTITDDQSIYEWWILDNTGELLATFNWPRIRELQQVRGGYAYFLEREEETGIQEVVRYRIDWD